MYEIASKQSQRRLSRATRISILMIISGLFVILVGLGVQYFNVSTFQASRLDQYSKISDATIAVVLVGLSAVVLGILAFSAAYLDVFSSGSTDKINKDAENMSELQEKYTSLAAKVERMSANNADKQVKAHYERIFREEFKDKFDQKFGKTASEIVKEATLQNYSPQIYKESSFRSLQSMADLHISGLQSQIQAQIKNANFNVWAGLLFSVVGLIVMGYIVFEFNTVRLSLSDWTQFLFAFIPKFTFVLLFESISFFFFRAYREDRAMVRYLRNEATNMEEKALGIMASALFSDAQSVSQSVASLMLTERNFIIKKGDKTIVEAMQGSNPVLFETIINQVLNRMSIGQNLKGGQASESK